MPIQTIAQPTNATLWRAFVDAFLGELGDHTGPGGYEVQAWLTHRIQRDRLYREAAVHGLKGWLDPPVSFFSDLPRLFDLRRRPIGLVERQTLLDRLAAHHATKRPLLGDHAPGSFDRPGLGRAVDHVLSELLPEGVTPDGLERGLEQISADEFARQRNEWLALVFRDYLKELDRLDRYDPRAIHAIIADCIAGGELPRALKAATRLHVYGVATDRTRRRLLQALAAQQEVEVLVYRLADAEAPASPIRVQPAPDEHRELEFVALEAKKLVVEQRIQPDDIAVVARTGHEDARLAYEILTEAGLPVTARIRSSFAEIPALRAILQLLRAAALEWTYRPLRHVLENSYFDIGVNLKTIDHLGGKRRHAGLDSWLQGIARLEELTGTGDDDDPAREGFRKERLERDRIELARFAEHASRLSAARPLAEWVRVTTELVDPGWFGFRKRICRDCGGRWDIVRLDQQGVEALKALLVQWEGAASESGELSPADWYSRLRRFLSGNQIALSTPLRTGVQVLEAHEAVLVPFAHTFLIHANDGEFPKRPGPGWLFTDLERRILGDRAGLPLQDREAALDQEQALWRAVTAGPAVTITYRTADTEGVPLLASLLVPRHDERDAIPRTQYVWSLPFTRHHADRTTLDRVRQALGRGQTATARRLDPIRHAILRARAESHRLGSADGNRPAGGLDPWNGHLRDARLLESLKERFGPDHVWSASQLEEYARNPFVFLVNRVLWLDEILEAPEDTDPLNWGNVAHRVLERFYHEYRGPFPAVFGAEPARIFEQVWHNTLCDLEREGTWLGLPAIWRSRQLDLRQRLEELLQWELPRLGNPWKPDQLELGPARRTSPSSGPCRS